MGEFIILIIVMIVTVAWAFISAETDPMKKLQEVKEGMTLTEVVNILGGYNSISKMHNGYHIQWMPQTGIHISMRFTFDQKLIEITHICDVRR